MMQRQSPVALQLVPEASEVDQHLSRQGVEARLVVNRDDGDMPAMPGESDLHHSGLQAASPVTAVEGRRRLPVNRPLPVEAVWKPRRARRS
jgi:hypothetical protein